MPERGVRLARRARVLTQGQVAARAAELVEQATDRQCGIDADYLSAVVRGEIRWPSAAYRSAFWTGCSVVACPAMPPPGGDARIATIAEHRLQSSYNLNPADRARSRSFDLLRIACLVQWSARLEGLRWGLAFFE